MKKEHDKTPIFASGKGIIYSFTRLIDAPDEFQEFAPYYVAIIELDEGPRITARLTDIDPNMEIKIGMPVEMVTRILKREGPKGLIVYGMAFRISGELENYHPNPLA